jgi:lysophospholipase L1-like esterase
MDFKNWIPDVVFICLGINDNSGLKNKDGEVTEEKSEIFRNGYHNFLKTIRENYPNTKIILVASYSDWARKNIKQVYDEEISGGNKECFLYTIRLF